jgi:hypothetical protein
MSELGAIHGFLSGHIAEGPDVVRHDQNRQSQGAQHEAHGLIDIAHPGANFQMVDEIL